MPNLNITYGSGKPNEGTSINIRGFGSINEDAKPLVLIDGVEGNLDNINPRDVESISVLKDASSAAIYGARASFGVILVTTKKDKTAPPKSAITDDSASRARLSRPISLPQDTMLQNWSMNT